MPVPVPVAPLPVSPPQGGGGGWQSSWSGAASAVEAVTTVTVLLPATTTASLSPVVDAAMSTGRAPWPIRPRAWGAWPGAITEIASSTGPPPQLPP